MTFMGRSMQRFIVNIKLVVTTAVVMHCIFRDTTRSGMYNFGLVIQCTVCETSGFRRGVVHTVAFLGSYIAYIGNRLSTFGTAYPSHLQESNKLLGPWGWDSQTVPKGQYALRNISEDRRPQFTASTCIYLAYVIFIWIFFSQLYRASCFKRILKFILKQLLHVSVQWPSSGSVLFELAKVMVIKIIN